MEGGHRQVDARPIRCCILFRNGRQSSDKAADGRCVWVWGMVVWVSLVHAWTGEMLKVSMHGQRVDRNPKRYRLVSPHCQVAQHMGVGTCLHFIYLIHQEIKKREGFQWVKSLKQRHWTVLWCVECASKQRRPADKSSKKIAGELYMMPLHLQIFTRVWCSLKIDITVVFLPTECREQINTKQHLSVQHLAAQRNQQDSPALTTISQVYCPQWATRSWLRWVLMRLLDITLNKVCS